MNADVQSAIEKCVQWVDLPNETKRALGNSPKEYEKCILSFSISNQLRYRDNLVKYIRKDERAYYEDLLETSRNNLMLYPYHLSDVIVKGLRITPFQYYASIIESMIDQDKSYDSIPNFTAVDCLRLVGVGRNEYIELMNRCRSGRKLFRRKSVLKGLMPLEPVNISIEPWWVVDVGCVTEDDIKIVSEEEKLLIDRLIDDGKLRAGDIDYHLVLSLYKRGLIYLEVPVEDNDYIAVSTLEGFVMNRVLGDYLEKLLYKILVSIDDRTSVNELASLLQIDLRAVKNAVSLFCRLGLARKKRCHIESYHSSWDDVVQPSETKIKCEKLVDDPLLKELNDALVETNVCFKENPLFSPEVSDYNITDSPCSTQKRIAFLFDSTLTAFLMMGNLCPNLKKHAVKMFEAGKLTDEDLDDFLNELKSVGAVRDDTEGEARRYFDHALILRSTVLSLRSDSSRRLDLIRCESLQSLDQEIDRFLVKNYFLLVSMAPLNKEVHPITCPVLPHLGPASPAINSIWFKLFLYYTTGCGPPSVLFPRGTRLKRIPDMLREICDKVLVTSWGHEPASLSMSNMLFALNEALLYSPVLVQAYCRDELYTVPFPFSTKVCNDSGIDWTCHSAIRTLMSAFNLNNTCGYITLLRTDRHCKSCIKAQKSATGCSITGEENLIEGSSNVSNTTPMNGVTSEENKLLLQQEVDNVCLQQEKEQNPKRRHNVRFSLPVSTISSVDPKDWCLLDCNFGVPLFDTKLNSIICESIIDGGLWNGNSLEQLVMFNNHLSESLANFIQKFKGTDKLDEILNGGDVPWPVNTLVFNRGELTIQ